MGFENPIVGGTALRIPAIQSPNYVAGSSGWIIKIDGSAEFNNLTVRGEFSGNDFVINSSGVFLYSGTPAAGNMSGSWASAAGTDAHGNAYPEGLKIYSSLGSVLLSATDGVFQSTGASGKFIDINDGQITFSSPNDDSTATIIQNLIQTHGSLYAFSGKQAANDQTMEIGLITGAGPPTTGQPDTFPRLSVAAGSGSSFAYQYVTGAVIRTSDLVGNTAEVWQVVGGNGAAYGTNWAASSTFNGSANWASLRYRRDAEDNVWLLGAFKATGAVGGTVFTLPAAYRPTAQWPLYCQQNSGGTLTALSLEVGSSGNVNLLTQVGASLVSGHEYLVNGKIPMGNIT